jgi:tetratricopeptide (TPR) repeat protein
MGNRQSEQRSRRKYDPEDDILDIGIDEEVEGFRDSNKNEEETKDSIGSSLHEKPQPQRSDSLRTENAVTEARKLFLEGNRLFREGRFDAAKSYYEHALLVLRDQLTEHPATAALALSNLGILEFSEGRFNQAKELLREALDLRQRVSLAKIFFDYY